MEDLQVGTPVSLQKHIGNHSQVVIRVDGSRRVTTRNRRFVRPLHPALRMEVSSKPVMRKERSSNLVMRKEKRREVPVHEVPVHEVPIHEAPSVDRVPVPSGD